MNPTDELIERLTKEIMSTYANIESELIYKVARLWADIENRGGTVEHLIEALNEMNVLNADTLKTISKITGTPLNIIPKDLKTIGYHSVDNNMFSKAFEQGVIASLPKTKLIDTVVNRHVKFINKEMKYIEEQAKSGMFKQTFKAITHAQMEVEMGVKSNNQAITDAVSKLAEQGIQGTSYIKQDGTEVHQNIEAVVRRAVRTSFINMANEISEELAEDLGTTNWYVTQHLGARTTGVGYENHAQWQGGVYTDEEMVSVCGDGHSSGRGFNGYNCRHRKMPYIPGISVTPPPKLDIAELERVYDLEQAQRRHERNIKTTKRQINALGMLTSPESIKRTQVLEKRLKKQQKTVRDHVKNNYDVLRRDYSREKVIEPKGI